MNRLLLCIIFGFLGGFIAHGQTGEVAASDPGTAGIGVLSDKKLCTMHAGAIRQSFVVSSDLSKVVYVVGERGKQHVMINDNKSVGFAGVGGLTLSPDASRMVYGAQTDNRWHVVLDGKASEASYKAVGGFAFSPNSQRIAYIALRQGKTIVIVDGQELGSYRIVRQPVFSPDNKRVAYIAIDEDSKHLVCVDGKGAKRYSAIAMDTPEFSPDGSRLAYVVAEDNKFFIVVDGQEGDRFDGIGTSFGKFIWFSSDGKHFAYVGKNKVETGEESYLILDNEKTSRYEAIYCVAFSPTTDRIAYAGKTEDGVYLNLDGKRTALKFDDILRIQWKPDGSGVALVAEDEGQRRVVMQKEHQPDYDSIHKNRVVFSQDGRRYAYVGVRKRSWHVVVDGKETGVYPGLGAPVSFSADGKHFAYGALIKYDMERVQALEIMRLAGMGDWDKIIGRGEQKMVLIVDKVQGRVHEGFLTAGGAAPIWQDNGPLKYLYISEGRNIRSAVIHLE